MIFTLSSVGLLRLTSVQDLLVENIFGIHFHYPKQDPKALILKILYFSDFSYNREHSFPRSWWGGSTQIGAYTDLMHVFPADGYNNIKRSNNPIDYVDEPLHYRMSNGGKIGPCRNFKPLRCFEPTDSVKGDFARAYFYMSVRYWNEFKCCDMLGTNGARIKPVLEKILREWNRIDPVSAFERQRNDAAFNVQKNRNPFIDHPVFVDRITSFSE